MPNHKNAADDRKHGRHGNADASQPQAGTAKRLIEGIEANPLALVAGGLALGAVAGALLPRSERERDLLAPVGVKLGGALTAALAAAREAGQTELDSAGINRDAARDQVKSLFDGLLKAASSAGSAAVHAAATGKPATTNPGA